MKKSSDIVLPLVRRTNNILQVNPHVREVGSHVFHYSTELELYRATYAKPHFYLGSGSNSTYSRLQIHQTRQTSMADLNLQEIQDTLIAVAHEAGRMMLAANPTDIDKGTKLNCKSVNTYVGGTTPPFYPSAPPYVKLFSPFTHPMLAYYALPSRGGSS